MREARPSTTAVLPTPGSPISTGLFFWRRERICITRSISVWRPTTGSSFPSTASFVRLRPNWSRSFELFVFSPGGRARARLAAARAGEHADDLVPDLFRIRVEVEQDARGDALVLAHEAEEDVLGADVVVAEREGFAQRQLEDLLGARRERNLARGDLVALADDARDLGADLLHGDVERLEDAGGEALLLAEQPEQDVLGADVVVLQRPRLVLGEDDDLPGPFGESLEQLLRPSFLYAHRRSTGLPRSGSKVPD